MTMDTKSADYLAEQAKSRDPAVREAAVEALGRAAVRQAEVAVPALIAALRDRSCTIRRKAAASLAGIGPPASQAIPALTEALQDRIHTVRDAARQALERVQQSA